MKLFLLLFLMYKMIKSEEVHFNINIMLRPMCEARCLDILVKQTTALNTSNLPNRKISSHKLSKYCSDDNKCSGCLAACKAVEKTIDKCLSSCDGDQTRNQLITEKQQACIDSCRNLESYRKNRPGKCPTINNSDVRSKFKIRRQCSSYECNHDYDCYKIATKCCRTEVNCFNRNSRPNKKMCLIADPPSENVPPVPKVVNIEQITNKKQSEISLDIDWSDYPLDSLNYPVVFEVQMRIQLLNDPIKNVYGSWTHIHTTPRTGLILTELVLDKSYQFRVIAFSRYGSLNIARKTKPITIDYKPSQIPAPNNVREVVTQIETQQQSSSTLTGNNLLVHPQQQVDVSVTLQWDLEKLQKKLLVPITLFKITWRKFYPDNENVPLVKRYSSYSSGIQNRYTIKNLKPSTTYEVKIQSIIDYRSKRYNSLETIYFITTVPFVSKPLTLPKTNYKFYNKGKPSKENNQCLCQGFNAKTPIKFKKFLVANDNLVYIISLKDIDSVNKLLQEQKRSLRLNDNMVFKLKWHPTACIVSQYKSNRIIREVGQPSQSQVSYLTKQSNYKSSLENLDFRCNYWLEIDMSLNNTINHTSRSNRRDYGPVLSSWKTCFCTPNCLKEITDLPPNNKCYKNNGKLAYKPIRLPVPMNIRASIVSRSRSNESSSANKETGEVNIEWTIDPAYVQSDSKFRITWAPRLPEPLDESFYGGDLLPIMDMSKANCKIIGYLQKSITLSDLTPSLIYVVKVETIYKDFNSQPGSIYFKYPSKQSNYKNSSTSNKIASINLFYFTIIFTLSLVTCRFQ